MKKSSLEEIADTWLPHPEFGRFIVRGFKKGEETALALEIGRLKQNPSTIPLTRIHSQCVFGETLHSLKCDCYEQLQAALAMISKQSPGILIYLFQEGRGAGLLNKLKGYALEDRGLDTVEAYKKLHLPIDQRQYTLAADILKHLKVPKIRLLTNNPAKIVSLKENGIEIAEHIPLEVQPNKFNRKYLQTKKNKMSHLLRLV